MATAADRIGKLRGLDPDDPYICTRLAYCLLTGPTSAYDAAAAARFARRAVAGLPTPADAGPLKYRVALAHAALGLASYHLGDDRAAVTYIHRAVATDARAVSVYAWSAGSRARLRTWDPAGAARAVSEMLDAWVRQARTTFDPPKKK